MIARSSRRRWHLALAMIVASACTDRAVRTSTDGGADDGSETADAGTGATQGASEEGGPDAGSEAGSAPGGTDDQAGCAQPWQCDPYNCGPNRIACGDGFVEPICLNGNCGPRLSPCAGGPDLAPTSCSEICAQDGAICVPNACRGETGYVWSDFDPFFQACTEYVIEGVLDGACEQLIDFSDPSSYRVRCCCDYPS